MAVRTEVLKCRLTKEEKELIVKNSKKKKMTITEYIVGLVLADKKGDS